eukprot:scaffold301194_cov19-Tisochrysis_lutea.AAC.1
MACQRPVRMFNSSFHSHNGLVIRPLNCSTIADISRKPQSLCLCTPAAVLPALLPAGPRSVSMHVMALPGVASLPPMGCGLMRVWQELADLGLLFGQLDRGLAVDASKRPGLDIDVVVADGGGGDDGGGVEVVVVGGA